MFYRLRFLVVHLQTLTAPLLSFFFVLVLSFDLRPTRIMLVPSWTDWRHGLYEWHANCLVDYWVSARALFDWGL
jgi:hypothetical protein